MRVYVNKPFQRFARKEGVEDSAVWEAVDRAERGLIDADLGGGLIKQRIPRPNEGRSGGFRSIVVFRTGQMAFFVHGFAKSERDNLSSADLEMLKKLAGELLGHSEAEIQIAVDQGKLRKVERQ